MMEGKHPERFSTQSWGGNHRALELLHSGTRQSPSKCMTPTYPGCPTTKDTGREQEVNKELADKCCGQVACESRQGLGDGKWRAGMGA